MSYAEWKAIYVNEATKDLKIGKNSNLSTAEKKISDYEKIEKQREVYAICFESR